ncbi:MAG: hypothetical protein WAV48_04895 [Candidatus Magasanikiibacteriota bacterium]
MNTPEFLNYFLLAGFAMLGWFAREMWSAVKDLRLDLMSLKDYVAQNYTRKDDFKEFRSELLGFLQRIETKLDGKQDKI